MEAPQRTTDAPMIDMQRGGERIHRPSLETAAT
jgi:hypothetical protein